MMNTRQSRTLDLEQHELLHLPRARGTVVRVNRGVVWLTEHRDPRDIVLSAGDTWMVEHGGLTLLEAQRSATVTVTGPGARSAHRHNRQPSFVERIARALACAGVALPARQAPYY
jgi:hypothetical protein